MADFPIAVLISGSGSTLLNLLERSRDGRLHARVCGVIASRECTGLDRAAAFEVPHTVVPRLSQPGAVFDPAEFSTRVTSQLDAWRPSLIVLAGFLSPYLPAPQYAGRVINIHPGLLPHFGGKGMYGERVHQAVLVSGAQVSGCTVHLVDDEYDHGATLAQRAVPVLPGDTTTLLAQRVMEAERELYPEVINWFAQGRVGFDGQGRVELRERRILDR